MACSCFYRQFQEFPGISSLLIRKQLPTSFSSEMTTVLEESLQRIGNCPVEAYKGKYRRALTASINVDLDYEAAPRVYSPARINEEFGIQQQTQLEYLICIDRILIARFLGDLGLPVPTQSSIDKKISASAYQRMFGSDVSVSKANNNKNVYTYAEVLHLLGHNTQIYLPEV